MGVPASEVSASGIQRFFTAESRSAKCDCVTVAWGVRPLIDI